jgi:hypothetical protein
MQSENDIDATAARGRYKLPPRYKYRVATLDITIVVMFVMLDMIAKVC